MNKKALMIAAIVVVIAAAAFTMMGGGSKEDAEVAGKADLNSLTVEQLLAKAKEEGRVDSVGMPDSWANWVQTWTDLKDKYGIPRPRSSRFLRPRRTTRRRTSATWGSPSGRSPRARG